MSVTGDCQNVYIISADGRMKVYRFAKHQRVTVKTPTVTYDYNSQHMK